MSRTLSAARPRRLIGELKRRRILRRMMGPKLVDAFARAYPEAFFVEIGANDGEQHDFLRPYVVRGRWRGIMVEPVPFVFERLERNYAGIERVTLENVAIADRDGRLPFFHLAEAAPGERERLPSWYDGLGSFSREIVLGHSRWIPDIERRLVATEVPCVTLESLLARHGDPSVDLLLVDAEGFDWEIVRRINFDAIRPRLLIFEHLHLSDADRRAALAHLDEVGYERKEEHFDTFCLDTSIADRLTREWRRLRPGVPGVSAGEPVA